MAANGSYDFQFRVYTAATGGAQQGFTVTRTAVAVVNGIFTVQLESAIDGLKQLVCAGNSTVAICQ